MDNDNKYLLEATVKGLQDKIGALNLELKQKQQDLEDANKPVISSTTLDVVNDAVNSALEDYNFDCGMFEYEFNLNHENKLELSDLTFTDNYDIVEAIVLSIEKQFKIKDDEKTNE